MRITCLVAFTVTVGASSLTALAQPAQGTAEVKAPDPTEAITRLREELIDSFNKGDLDRLLSHLSPDVVVTWQDGSVCHTPAEVRAYYNRMMAGPSPVVKTVTASPVVDGRQVHDGWAVSWGHMNDHFELTDGKKLDMDSRFTATISRDGEAWKVSSFHASTDTFANPVLGLAIRRTATWVGAGAGGAGLVIGCILGAVISRRTRTAA